MTFETITAFSTCVVAIGGVGAVIPRGVRGLRRIGRLLDGFLGDGTEKHKSLPDRIGDLETSMTEVKTKLDEHVDREVPEMMAGGQDWGNRLEERGARLQQSLDAINTRLTAVEKKTGL